MAITFLEEKKRQKYLIWILAILVFTTLFTVWYSFFKEKGVPVSREIAKPPEVKINFDILKSPLLQELQPFETISSLSVATSSPFATTSSFGKEVPGEGGEVKVGRENPFVPFATGTATGIKPAK